MSHAKLTLYGNLTRDPELKTIPNGTEICEFAVAHNFKKAGRDEVMFLDVTFFGKQAQIAAQYLKKGNPVLLDGRLEQDSWDDKQTGQKKTKIKILGDSLTLVGRKNSPEEDVAAPATSKRAAPAAPKVYNPRVDDTDEVPF